ncbi:MAG TPA: hypothetical protein VE091_03455 [Gemmatimonadales bacterium]|nr:hypothetical protein [Gemmatimonadales bacterium]
MIRSVVRGAALSLLPLTSYLSLGWAQAWNSPAALDLVARAVARREAAQADPALQSYHTRAHGFVFFLAQIGREGLGGPPRLVKADELDVEVYWQAPNRSKQIIHGWRDRSFLPTDIAYHRDHLGIVTNNFGDLIRIGEGDEVRDAVHPLSAAGLAAYDFSLGDSLTIRGPRGDVRVREVLVRPRAYDRPLVVGRLYLDAQSAELVRFRFSFTPAAYLERTLEDITVVLENSLREGRFWLPYRQEIEIRRRANWVDFPVRGIIRGRWEIGDYDLDTTIPPAVLAGPDIGGLQQPRPEDSTWSVPLRDAIAAESAPIERQDMEAIRVEVSRLASAHVLSGLPAARLATGSVSDLVHVNRVQGLTLGIGGAVHFGQGRLQLRPTAAFGTSDQRLTGGLAIGAGVGATDIELFGGRSIRDLSDVPVISPVLNSLLAQENGDDYGDYVLLDAAGARLRHRLGGRGALGLEIGVERSRSLDVAATPARGTYRPNPSLGAGTYRLARLRLERGAGGLVNAADASAAVGLEVGDGPTSFIRGSLDGTWRLPFRGSALAGRVHGGIGSDGLPAYRSFVLGGRGTLVGEPFRGYGGRAYALAELEWQLDLPIPALSLGSFASTGRTMVVAPFLAAGWAERPYGGLPWAATSGVRPVAGVALELLMRLLRVEAGVGLRDGGFGLTFDVHPGWWGLL